MPRVQPKSLPAQERKELLDDLWNMIALLEDKEEVHRFFRDLLSETEAIMLARRVQIAKALLHGVSYEEIKVIMHTSDVTIAGVHRWLQSGFGGYTSALPRLEKAVEQQRKGNEKQRDASTPYSFEWLKRRYPIHFLLFNLFDRPHQNSKKKKVQ